MIEPTRARPRAKGELRLSSQKIERMRRLISTRGVAKVKFFIYHTKWEAHVRMVR
jgi:hypothetical protein